MLEKTFLILQGIVLILGGCSTSKEVSSQEKPIILIAAFGSSYESGQANLNDFDKTVVQAFPDHEVSWAFTSWGTAATSPIVLVAARHRLSILRCFRV